MVATVLQILCLVDDAWSTCGILTARGIKGEREREVVEKIKPYKRHIKREMEISDFGLELRNKDFVTLLKRSIVEGRVDFIL